MRPTLVINPVADRDFRGFAESHLQRAQSAPELQRRLRTRYPAAVVRARELTGERVLVWYVYRDGRWTRSADHQP
jgi:hypothetical protein